MWKRNCSGWWIRRDETNCGGAVLRRKYGRWSGIVRGISVEASGWLRLPVEVALIASGLVARLLALALGNGEVGTGCAGVSRTSSLLIELAGCMLRRRSYKMMDEELVDDMVWAFPGTGITELDVLSSAELATNVL